MRIALDIGHAAGTGARGNGLEEHAVATEIAKALAPMLRTQGHQINVIDFPSKSNADDLNATIRQANAASYDFGISLHCDCSDNPSAKGAHVCYASARGKVLAECIVTLLAKLLPGRANKTVKRDNLAVLNKTKTIWVLIECGFISNVGDAEQMLHPEAIARAIFSGITDYVHSSK